MVYEEVTFGFVVAGGEGAKVLELEEKGFNKVSVLVALGVVATRGKPVGFGRDDGLGPFFAEPLEHPLVGVVGFVGQKLLGL